MKSRLLIALFGISICLLAITRLDETRQITKTTIEHASKILGLQFTNAEKDSMLSVLQSNREDLKELRHLYLDNDIPPALHFNPVPAGTAVDTSSESVHWDIPQNISLPENREDLAYYSVRELASLIKQRKISSVQLTRFFLDRIEHYGDTLEAIITVTRQRALAQARRLDKELENGNYRGPLHGIPYAAKDLFAVEGYKTTWGATPYKNQTIDKTATVIRKLDEAGAVLIAKSTLGALAYNDIWYGGKTRNPWNLQQGSSGSSAGSAAGTAAGLFPFALGTETWGSIISPATRCGVTGLRPTFGRVSRYGAMALSWSMDKVGPITRNAVDAGIVFDAIHGKDGQDQSIQDWPFGYHSRDSLNGLTIGYVESGFSGDYDDKESDKRTLDELKELGAKLKPVTLPDYPPSALQHILFAEAAAAFDSLTITNADDKLTWQDSEAWPNQFRSYRFMPAVEYIQANRARTLLVHKMDSLMQKVDLYVCPTFGANNLLLTNLTGHPSVVLPNGFNKENSPTSITFIGKLYDEGTLLEVAQLYQDHTTYHEKHPPLFSSSGRERKTQ